MASSIDSQLEWTVSRCFRVLRPIVSRKGTTMRATKSRNLKSDKRQMSATSTAVRIKFGESPNPKQDPDWMRQSKKSAPRQYYSKSSSSDPVSDLNAGALSIPTPMIARMRGVDVPQTVCTNFRSDTTADILSNKFVSQSDDLNFRSQKLVQGTLDLLEATNTCQDSSSQEAFFPSVGAKSLRAMCCRQYARHVVELEEEQEEEAAVDRFDVATEAYTLLEETMGEISGDYLRAIVREHGVRLFVRMITSSVIPRAHVIALIRRIRNPQHSRKLHTSTSEVEAIVSALLRATTPDNPCCSRNNIYGHKFNTLACISSQCEEGARSGFEFRQFGNLLESVMPLLWLGSRRLTALWTNTFRAFVDSTENRAASITTVRDASAFLKTALAIDSCLESSPQAAAEILNSTAIPDYYGKGLGCPQCPKISSTATFMIAPASSKPHTATNSHACRNRLSNSLNNSFSSFSAILASFAIASILQPTQLPNIDSGIIVHLLGDLSMDLLLTSDEDPLTRNVHFPFQRCTSILGAALVTMLSLRDSLGDPAVSINDIVCQLELLDRRARKATTHKLCTLELLPELLYSITRSSGKLLKSNGLDVLSHIVKSMTSQTLESCTNSSAQLFLLELVSSTVQMFAERTDSKEAHALARTLQNELSHGRAQMTPFKSTPRPHRNREGLKWEDGISEWVAASPELKHLGREAQTNNGSILSPKAQAALWAHLELTMSGNEDEESEEDIDESPSHEPADGISLLLLSPDPLSHSSPWARSNNSNPNQIGRPPRERLLNQECMVPTNYKPKVGAPLSDRSNLQNNPRKSVKTGKMRRPDNLKREAAAISSDDSDDELAQRPRKYPALHRITRKTSIRVEDMSHDSKENYFFETQNRKRNPLRNSRESVVSYDVDSCSALSSQEHASSRARRLLRAQRRNPRGTVLRSLSGPTKALQSASSMLASQIDVYSDDLSDEMEEDELSFTQPLARGLK